MIEGVLRQQQGIIYSLIKNKTIYLSEITRSGLQIR